MITLTWGIGPDPHGSEEFMDWGLALEEEQRLRAAGFVVSVRIVHDPWEQFRCVEIPIITEDLMHAPDYQRHEEVKP